MHFDAQNGPHSTSKNAPLIRFSWSALTTLLEWMERKIWKSSDEYIKEEENMQSLAFISAWMM